MATIERTYSEKFVEHALVIDGETVATAHKFNAIWSVKVGQKLLGLAKTEEMAVKTLDKVEAQFRKNLDTDGTVAPCPECSLPEAVHCTTCGWCPRESDGGCECTPVMASDEG